jgi:hypothetical protein
MKLDERAERAATDLLERASRRPIPTIEELEASTTVRRLQVRRLLAAAAVVAVIAGGVSFALRRVHPLPTVEHPAALPVPAGVTPQLVAPEGSGVTFELPSTWEHNGANRSFDDVYADGDESYVSVARIATVDALDGKAFADLRHDLLERYVKATQHEVSQTTIDGHDALVSDVDVPGFVSREYDIDLADGTWAVVFFGERPPAEHRAVFDWIASTIAVSSTPLWSSPIDHPAQPLPVPVGVAPHVWAPDGEGVAVDLPATWTEIPNRPKGFDAGMASTSGPPTWAYASRLSHALADADSRELVLERQFHARIVDRTDTVIDGHHVRIVRYRIPEPDEPRLAALGVEYDIDLGNNESVWLAIGTRGGSPADLIEWIRSTIRITA